MTTLRRLVFASCAAFSLGAPAPAQITGVTVTAYGQPCNPLFGGPTMRVALDSSLQQLSVLVVAPGGCCNTFLTARLLALGLGQATIPLPTAPPCALLVSPDLVLFLPVSGGDTFTLPLPPGLQPLTLYGQAAAMYFTTIGFSTDVALTAGAEIDLS